MRPRRLLPGRIAPATLVVAALVLASACGGSDPHQEVGKAAEYVALGDSYTAGPGIEPIADDSCHRSQLNYPSLVDKALAIKKFADRSCAGARIANLTEPQSFRDPRTGLPVRMNEPQLNALGAGTKLVTIGMGLNDRAISTGLLLICTTPGSPEPNDTCKGYLKQPESAVDAQINAAAAELGNALQLIAKKAPHARIVVVGYPRVVPDEGSCGAPGQADSRLPVPEAQVTRMREALKVVNEQWSAVAKQAGALYVDMYTASEGHDICSDDPWINGYLPVPGKAQGLHPFASYEKAVADRIVELVKRD
jgi:lysophospholipase L1-like esterase